MSAKIILGAELPKDWRLNLILQKDENFQLLLDKWDEETDAQRKEQLHLKLEEYREKVRKEHNLPKPE